MAKEQQEFHVPDGYFEIDTSKMHDPALDQVEDQEQEDQPLTREELLAVLEQQNKDRAAEQQRWEAMFARQGQPQRQETQQEQPAIDVTGLPNPAVDYEGFMKGFAERTGQAIARIREGAIREATGLADQRLTQAQVLDNAWVTFQKAHPDLAEHPELVETAMRRLREETEMRGGDLMQILATNPDAVVETVAERVGATVQRIRGFKQDDGEEASGRTQMVDGRGRTSGGRRQAKEDAQAPGLADQLKAAQKELGIF